MLFNSYIFILLFLPLCLVVYFALQHFKLRIPAQVFLVGMSLWFYGYANPSYLPIICVSILVNYLVYFFMGKLKHRKIMLTIGLIFNLMLFGYFKYMDFFIGNINAVFKSDLPLLKIALPLGISFFTFQQVSFILDAYKGEVGKTNFIEYACFVSFFPQLIAGPIVSHDEILPQLRDESKAKPSWQNLSMGFYMFTMGMAKKVLIADTFSTMADPGFSLVYQGMTDSNVAQLNTTEAWIVLVGYAIQLYFDFSGYCDMAIGIGRMMNIELPLNFNSPYKSRNIADFWNRWHMTLTRFFTKYVYIPMGGSRKGVLRTYVNVLFIFLVSGFWHGAGWGYILWGLVNGIFVALYRATRKWVDKIPKFITWFGTIIIFDLSLIFFRSSSVPAAIEYYKKLFAFDFGAVRESLYSGFMLPEFEKIISITPGANYGNLICTVVFFIVAIVIVLFCKNANEKMLSMKPKLGTAFLSAALFIWCVMSLGGVSTFLYFNF